MGDRTAIRMVLAANVTDSSIRIPALVAETKQFLAQFPGGLVVLEFFTLIANSMAPLYARADAIFAQSVTTYGAHAVHYTPAGIANYEATSQVQSNFTVAADPSNTARHNANSEPWRLQRRGDLDVQLISAFGYTIVAWLTALLVGITAWRLAKVSKLQRLTPFTRRQRLRRGLTASLALGILGTVSVLVSNYVGVAELNQTMESLVNTTEVDQFTDLSLAASECFREWGVALNTYRWSDIQLAGKCRQRVELAFHTLNGDQRSVSLAGSNISVHALTISYINILKVIERNMTATKVEKDILPAYHMRATINAWWPSWNDAIAAFENCTNSTTLTTNLRTIDYLLLAASITAAGPPTPAATLLFLAAAPAPGTCNRSLIAAVSTRVNAAAAEIMFAAEIRMARQIRSELALPALRTAHTLLQTTLQTFSVDRGLKPISDGDRGMFWTSVLIAWAGILLMGVSFEELIGDA